jgi:hypothetical protein
MSMASPEDLQRPTTSKSWYVGIVVDNNDPEKAQRVKVRVAEMNRGVEDAALAWAMPQAVMMVGNTGGVGSMFVPVIGSKVYVRYLDSSTYYPIYCGYVTSSDAQVAELMEGYPNSYGWIDGMGNKVFFSASGTIDITHATGAKFLFSAAGDVTVKAAKDLTLEAGGAINLNAGGGVGISSGAGANVSGPSTKIANLEATGRVENANNAQRAEFADTAGALGGSAPAPAAIESPPPATTPSPASPRTPAPPINAGGNTKY